MAGGKSNVLILEDSTSFLQALLSKLDNARFNITIARNGQEGIEKFKRGKFDIVLSDFSMPIMNGGDACTKIREMDKTVKIILWTDNPDQINKAYPVDLVLEKWENIEKIGGIMSRLLGGPKE